MDLASFFRRKPSSKDLARDRLKLVLVHDRTNVSSEFLELVRDEIMQVLSKYMDVSGEGLDIQITRTPSEDGSGYVPALTANIPLKGMKGR